MENSIDLPSKGELLIPSGIDTEVLKRFLVEGLPINREVSVIMDRIDLLKKIVDEE